MGMVLDFLSAAFLALGSFLLFTGGLGLLRFPDFFTRIHATGVCETMGAGFILVGLMLIAGIGIVTFKLIFILLFLLITCPTASHTLSKSAEHGGLKPYLRQPQDGKDGPLR